MSYKDMAIKLHGQFAHPAATKLLKLIKYTDKDVDELREQINSVHGLMVCVNVTIVLLLTI